MKFPELKTELPNLILTPIAASDLTFLTELLNTPTVNATLFRSPTAVSKEKQHKNLEKMYDSLRPKEITYIIKIKKLLSSIPIGYVKIKLIDWEMQSCYLSTALLESPEYRGKGFARHAYNAFFTFLFSIGICKIYGRTYETNDTTIALNEATGFNFVGRQHNFVLYPDNTTLDALLFEKVNKAATSKTTKLYKGASLAVFGEFASVAYNTRDISAVDSVGYLQNTIKKYRSYLSENTLLPPSSIVETTTTDASVANTDLLSSIIKTEKLPLAITRGEKNNLQWKPESIEVTISEISTQAALSLLILSMRFANAQSSEHPFIGIVLTKEQLETHNRLVATFNNILSAKSNWLTFDQRILWGGACTEKTLPYISRLLLGRAMPFDFLTMLNIAKMLTVTMA